MLVELLWHKNFFFILTLIFGRLLNVIKLRELCAGLEMSEGLKRSESMPSLPSGKQRYAKVLVLVKLCASIKRGVKRSSFALWTSVQALRSVHCAAGHPSSPVPVSELL